MRASGSAACGQDLNRAVWVLLTPDQRPSAVAGPGLDTEESLDGINWYLVDVVRVLCHCPDHAGRRPVRHRRRQTTPRQRARGSDLVGDLGQRLAALCRRAVALPRWHSGPRNGQPESARVHHRLPDREVAGGGQRLRLADAVRLLCDPPPNCKSAYWYSASSAPSCCAR